MKTWLVKLLLLSMAAMLASVAYYFFFPDVAALRKGIIKKTSFMAYRESEWQQQGKKIRIRQVWIPLSQISPFLIKAVLIAEDDKFWQHEGFDFGAIEKAAEKDFRAKKFKFGASTISQQLAKNLYLSPSKNPLRKIKEAILTWRMEKKLTKRRILELYLNVAEWGEGIFGVEAASRSYYGKPASELDPEEAARLASALPNPIKYNPRGKSRYIANRSRIIYNIMVKRGIVIPQYEEVMTAPQEKETVSETVSPSVSPQAASGN
ncbi:MAG TPA: monofunctional biosynthetic peptidoglycan transglycosylase [Dissulfurispiraceae bacterium]|nr:monofunctional biosynthetic peptidoglycan transglycosylase [Dissulfurispiraceae bacterium]